MDDKFLKGLSSFLFTGNLTSIRYCLNVILKRIVNDFTNLDHLYWYMSQVCVRSSHQRCSVRKVFLEISQNSQENICPESLFLITLQVFFCYRFFSCEFCEISKRTFFHRTPLVPASDESQPDLIILLLMSSSFKWTMFFWHWSNMKILVICLSFYWCTYWCKKVNQKILLFHKNQRPIYHSPIKIILLDFLYCKIVYLK